MNYIHVCTRIELMSTGKEHPMHQRMGISGRAVERRERNPSSLLHGLACLEMLTPYILCLCSPDAIKITYNSPMENATGN